MDSFVPQEVAEKIMEAIKKARDSFVNLNVMVLGKTGVGKSTLINNMFNESLASTGTGKPVTQQIRRYEKPGFPLAIYDTPGLELGGNNSIDKLLDEVTGVIIDGVKSGDVNKAIHCIWYCVSTPSHRFENAEKEFITRLSQEINKYTSNLPVIIILTQSYSKSDAKTLQDEIGKENLDVAQIIPVLAADFDIDEDYTAKAFGLDKLADVVESVIPEAVKSTLVAVQKANIKLKKNKAQAIVAASAAVTAATGATPIPFSDAFLLVPEQISMIAGITAVFGLPVEKATITSIISATIGTAGATVLGKTVVSGILKFIPGAGSVLGGAISGSIAAALTAALGESYIGIMVLVLKGDMKLSDLDTDKGKAQITTLFKEKLRLKRNNKGEIEKK